MRVKRRPRRASRRTLPTPLSENVQPRPARVGPPPTRAPEVALRMRRTKWGDKGRGASPGMDPKWNPAALMLLGTALTVFSYLTSNGYPLIAVITGMTIGGLVLASGVVLAFIQTFRD